MCSHGPIEEIHSPTMPERSTLGLISGSYRRCVYQSRDCFPLALLRSQDDGLLASPARKRGRWPMASAYDKRLSTDPVNEAFHPVDLENARWSRTRPSLARRAFRALVRFAIVVGIGVGGTLAWQSYGDVAQF